LSIYLAKVKTVKTKIRRNACLGRNFHLSGKFTNHMVQNYKTPHRIVKRRIDGMRTSIVLSILFLLWTSPIQAKSVIYPIAPELRSGHFHVTIGRQESPVAYAATTYYFFNFALKGKAKISVTADTDGYWDKGVEVQPWRWGIRPEVKGRTITFTIAEPMKLCISRPGDHGTGAEMLFLFANVPETDSPKPGQAGIHFYGPGAYHENIDAKSGETIYLAPGAVVFGALNLWGVDHVKVMGRGTIVYDGPQNPDHDEGWMHKPNWHVIVMDHARIIQISGITCVVRSRTWMIQMLGSHDITFDNIKVIGGCKGNANQDGMDWLGGGDTVVRDSFFRASDDVFALQGNWLGYDAQSMTTPGEIISNISIENSVLSTSISNVVRVSWPTKVFDTNHFKMTNSDVIHMGMGGCVVPFGLLEIWNDPTGKGRHSDYSFENIRLEDWYSMLQLRYPPSGIRNVSLKNVWALETPSLIPSVVSGDVGGVTIQNTKLAGELARRNEDVPLTLGAGTTAPVYSPGDGPRAAFHFHPAAVRPGTRVKFDATESAGPVKKYQWLFGDGKSAHGRTARHKFRDAKGTLMDGSGRFRVLLKVTDASGREDWASQPVVVADEFAPAVTDPPLYLGLKYQYYEGSGLKLPDLARMTPLASGTGTTLSVEDRKRAENYAFVFDGAFEVPADGGYTFLLLANDAAELQIDSHVVAVAPQPQAQVCGTIGNMVQLTTGSIALKAGKHLLHAAMTHSSGPDGFAVKWQGPGQVLADVRATVPNSSPSN
jgi:PKD domain/PA14 domain